jgi:hypothetical protein
VLLVEGGSARTRAPSTCSTGGGELAGGGKAVKKVDWSPLFGRK